MNQKQQLTAQFKRIAGIYRFNNLSGANSYLNNNVKSGTSHQSIHAPVEPKEKCAILDILRGVALLGSVYGAC